MAFIVSKPPPFRDRVLFDSVRLAPSAMKLDFINSSVTDTPYSSLPPAGTQQGLLGTQLDLQGEKLLNIFLKVTGELKALSCEWNLCAIELRAHYSNQKVLSAEAVSELLGRMKGILLQQLDIYSASPQFSTEVIRNMFKRRNNLLVGSLPSSSSTLPASDSGKIRDAIKSMTTLDIEKILRGNESEEDSEEEEVKEGRKTAAGRKYNTLLTPAKIESLERYLSRAAEIKNAATAMHSEISIFLLSDLLVEMRTHWLLNFDTLPTGKCAALSELNHEEWADISRPSETVTGIQTHHTFVLWDEETRKGGKGSATFETSLQIPPCFSRLEITNPVTSYTKEQLRHSSLCGRKIEISKVISELTSAQVRWAENYYSVCAEEVVPILEHNRKATRKHQKQQSRASESRGKKTTVAAATASSSCKKHLLPSQITFTQIDEVDEEDDSQSNVALECITWTGRQDDAAPKIVAKVATIATATVVATTPQPANPVEEIAFMNGVPLFAVRISMIRYVVEQQKQNSTSGENQAKAATLSLAQTDEYDEDSFFESADFTASKTKSDKSGKEERKKNKKKNSQVKELTEKQFALLCDILEPVGTLSARELVIPFNAGIMEKMASSRRLKNSFACDKLYSLLKEKLK